MLDQELKIAFDTLNENNVSYVVLRNYFPASNLNSKKDIDVLLNPRDVRKVRSLLASRGWMNRHVPSAYWGHYEIYRLSNQRKVHIFDFQKHLYFSQDFYTIINPENILKRRRLLENSVYVPDDLDALVLYVLRLALEKDKVEPSALAYVASLLELVKDPEEKVKSRFSDKLANLIDTSRLGDKVYYHELSAGLKENFSERRALKLWQKIKVKCARYLNLFRKQKTVLFIGVDGAGKGAMIEKLIDFSVVFKNKLYLGWRDYRFKFMEKLDNTKGINFFLFHSLLPIDLWLRYLRAKRNSKFGIIVIDRYPLPKSYRDEKSFHQTYQNFFLRLSHILLPEPDKVILLSGEPETIWQRKKEGGYDKFLFDHQRQEKAFMSFSRSKTRIDTVANSIDASFNLVLESLIGIIK